MARAAGAALGGAVKLSVIDPENIEHFKEHVYNIYRIPDAPAYWDNNGRVDPYKNKVDVNYTVGSGETIDVGCHFGFQRNDPSFVLSEGEGWEGGEDQENKTDSHVVASYPSSSNAIKPGYVIAELTFTDNEEDNTPEGDIHAIYFECQHDKIDTSRDVDHVDRSNNNANLFGPDMPMSAWHMKHALIGYLNRLTREAKPALTVPCLGIDLL